MLYNLIKKFLFLLDPETAHSAALNSLKFSHNLGLTKFINKNNYPLTVMNLEFSNPIGLAAGLDKNGDYIDALASLGFGFIEIGTVTPRAQDGNPKPRLFRIEKNEAIVNRMGFNNKGVDYLVEQVKKSKFKGILGINIGKNRDTPIENAIDDYQICFEKVYPYASYITVNISSPNTENLRSLQHGDLLKNLLNTLKQKQKILSEKFQKYVPLVVKISPDLTQQELQEMSEIFLKEKIDGIIATNTTTQHDYEKGGLSGKPLRAKSTEIIKTLHSLLKNQIPIIGCGGIFSEKDVKEKLDAGARLVQVYSGIIFRGVGWVERPLRNPTNY
jgi:dihydroorotate dehydrogenase